MPAGAWTIALSLLLIAGLWWLFQQGVGIVQVVVPNGCRGPVTIYLSEERWDAPRITGGIQVALDTEGKATLNARDFEFLGRTNQWSFMYADGGHIPVNLERSPVGMSVAHPSAEVWSVQVESDGARNEVTKMTGWVH